MQGLGRAQNVREERAGGGWRRDAGGGRRLARSGRARACAHVATARGKQEQRQPAGRAGPRGSRRVFLLALPLGTAAQRTLKTDVF